MQFLPTALPEVLVITPTVYKDARGFFMETWNANAFAAAGLPQAFVQDNHTLSRQGVLRGLHYQIHQPQGKLIRVVRGCIYDVAVDIRRHSPTFGHWVAEELSADNKRMLWIPVGFAHGFLVLSEEAEVLYKCTDVYAPEHQRAIAYNDPELAIAWPLAPGQFPLLAPKDATAPPLAQAEVFDLPPQT